MRIVVGILTLCLVGGFCNAQPIPETPRFLIEADDADTSVVTSKPTNTAIGFRSPLYFWVWSIYTGTGIYATFDTTDVAVDGDVLTYNSADSSVDWQPDAGAAASDSTWESIRADSARIDTLTSDTIDTRVLVSDSILAHSSGEIDLSGRGGAATVLGRNNTPSATVEIYSVGSPTWKFFGDTLFGFGTTPVITDIDSIATVHLDVDTIEMSGDDVADLNGDGLKVVANVLHVDTANAVANAEAKPVSGNAVFDYIAALPANDSTWESIRADSARIDTLTVDTLTVESDIVVTGDSAGTLTLSGLTGSFSMTVNNAAGTPAEWEMPTTDGSSGNQLTTDGAGVLSWAGAGGTGGLWDSSIVKTDTILYQISQPYDTAIQVMHDTTGYAAGTDTTHVQVPDGTILFHGIADDVDTNGTKISTALDNKMYNVGDTVGGHYEFTDSVSIINGNLGIGIRASALSLHVFSATLDRVIQVQTSKADGFAALGLQNDADQWTLRIAPDDDFQIVNEGTGTPFIIGNATNDITITGSINMSAGETVDGVDISELTGSDILMDTLGAPTFSTVQHLQNVFHSSGWVSGGAFTDTTDGAGDIDSLYIAAGTGLIRAADLAADTNAILFFDWPEATIAIPADTTLFIAVQYNSGTPILFDTTADKTLIDHQQSFELGIVTNETGVLHITFNPHSIGDHATTMIERTQGTMGIQRDNDIGGLILGEAGTRNPTVTAGTLYSKLNAFAISAIDLSVSGSMDRYYRAAGSGFTKEAAVTTWNNTQWDDGDGGLATIQNNRYAIQWFYVELDGGLVSMYGRAEYTSLALAEAETPPNTLPLRLTVNQAKLIGRLIFKESDATASEIQTVFTTSFPATAAEDHGNLGGLSDDDHTQYLLRSQFPDSVVKIVEDSIATMSLDSAFVGVSPIKDAVFGATTAKPGYCFQEPDAHFGDDSAGMIEIGDGLIAHGTRDTTYNTGLLDLGGTMIFRQSIAVDKWFEFVFFENSGDIRFVIPTSGVGLGTYNARSMFIAGPSLLNDSIVRFDYWGFSKIDADVAATGPDLGVQDDLEVMGKIYLDSLDNITAAPIEVLADLALNSNDITGADSVDITKYTDGSIDLPDLAANSVDSTKSAANSMAESDINWATRYIDLDIVHGWDPSDTTILSLPRREGYTPLLFRDSTAEASKKDTAYVTGTVPWTCTVDSIVFSYKVTGASVLIDSLVLRGPDRSAFTNLCDSTFFSSGTNRTSTSIARLAIDVTDFTANAGDRFGLWFANDLAADNGTVKVYYIQLVTKQ